ncbi:MAG: glycosyltransferase family 4 protein, partial [candidate division Zixibacteria bacterium]|nr:glycosyltransferase family 4 protein [candidate division Zixibacteria bacterium]
YSKSSIFCMPGVPHPLKVEGFGLAYLEAAAQGLPSIGTSIGGVPEVVRHDQTGIVIAPEDRRALASAINKLLTNNEYCIRLGRNARQEAEQFTWRRCAEATYEGL